MYVSWFLHRIWYVHIVSIWYIFSDFGTMHQEKSGNPGRKSYFPIDCLKEIIWCKNVQESFGVKYPEWLMDGDNLERK
jgi:hypothetical protein